MRLRWLALIVLIVCAAFMLISDLEDFWGTWSRRITMQTPIIQYIGSKAGSEGSPTSSLSDENQVQSAKKEEEEKWCLLENHPYHNMLKKHQFPSSCANKRFLIYLPPGMGFGAYLGSIAGVMEYALNTNRILILHQDFNAGWFAGVTKENCPSGTSQAYECYFKPLTNCTEQEALEAVGLTSVNQMLRNSSYFMIGDNPMRTVIGARYYNYENLYKNEVARLKTNAKEIRTEDSINDPMGYIISYLIRPNAWMAKILKGTFEEIIPKTILARAKNRHRGVLSLPIRGSDKCGTPVGAKSKHSRDESMCLSWHAYLEAIGDVEESFGEDFDIVIVTSEDKRYINAANEENIRRRKLKLMGAPSSKTTGSSSLLSNDSSINISGFSGQLDNVTFVLNARDIAQGTSTMWDISPTLKHQNVFVSMFSTLQLQMFGSTYIINCDSHWHRIISYLRSTVCGHSNTRTICLEKQSMEKPYHLCSSFHDGVKYAECKKKHGAMKAPK